VSGARYLCLSALRTRAPVLGLVALAFAVVGTYLDPRAQPGSTWALTALLGGALAAWITGATLASEPGPQADIAAAALGGRLARLRLDALLVAGVAVLITVVFVVYPLVLVAAGRDVFEPHAGAAEVLAALLAHLACGLAGGALGVAFSPPRVRRRATAALATLAALLALIIISAPLGDLGGPVAIATALSDAPSHHLTARELWSLLSTLVLLALSALAIRAWTARSG
jgi:hypothetical protein